MMNMHKPHSEGSFYVEYSKTCHC